MLDGILEYLKSAALWFVDWLKSLVLGILLPVLEKIGEYIPDDWNEGIATAITWLQFIDTWMPLSFGLKLYVAYYAIKALLLAVKYVLKIIPGVWG